MNIQVNPQNMDGYQTVSDDSRAEQISQNKHAMKSKLEQIF
ncbi:16055_t:CDS:2, partial [Funneliformis mosseae]